MPVGKFDVKEGMRDLPALAVPAEPIVSVLTGFDPDRCSCLEVAGEDPECALHGLTIKRIAEWSDADCQIQPEWESWTIRTVARATLNRLERIQQLLVTAKENGNFDAWTEAAQDLAEIAINGVCRSRPELALAAAARQGGDVEQAPAESPQSGDAKQRNAQTSSGKDSHD